MHYAVDSLRSQRISDLRRKRVAGISDSAKPPVSGNHLRDTVLNVRDRRCLSSAPITFQGKRQQLAMLFCDGFSAKDCCEHEVAQVFVIDASVHFKKNA